MALLDTAGGRWDEVVRDLQRLRTAEGRPGMFGEEAHGYRLYPPLSEGQVARFERRWGIRLPEAYREFVLRVGNGGAGPYYGVFKLGEMDEGFDQGPWDATVGDLSKPFPHSRAWNDRTGCPDDSEIADEEAYERALAEFEKRYFSPHVMDGAIPMCHVGCAIRHWLVVNGPEAGNVWCEDRASDNGVYPLQGKDGGRVTFLAWYREWVNEALARLQGSKRADRRQFWLLAGLLALGCLIGLLLLPSAGSLPLQTRAVIGASAVVVSVAVAWLGTKNPRQ